MKAKIWHGYLAALLDRLFDGKIILNCDHDPYLLRWYVVRTKRVGIFIHKFVRSDEDRALHDHPWSFLVIPLWGGYIEHSDRPLTQDEVLFVAERAKEHKLSNERIAELLAFRPAVVRRIWPIISTRYRDTTYRHRVELINERPSWSLFIRFTKLREWGFWAKEGFIQWNKWWQDKCE